MTRIKERLEEILAKTYLEHGLGTRPFGTVPDADVAIGNDLPPCSYKAGCAIGISMQGELRGSVANLNISTLLEWAEVQQGLFGWDLSQDERHFASLILGELQAQHDTAAADENRQGYAMSIEMMAGNHGLELPEREARA